LFSCFALSNASWPHGYLINMQINKSNIWKACNSQCLNVRKDMAKTHVIDINMLFIHIHQFTEKIYAHITMIYWGFFCFFFLHFLMADKAIICFFSVLRQTYPPASKENKSALTRCVMKHKCPRMRQILEVAINV
jgi:hypothetical protein